MEELELMSKKLKNLSNALREVCLLSPESSPIYKKCVEMKEYIDSCLRRVDREIDKLRDAGVV